MDICRRCQTINELCECSAIVYHPNFDPKKRVWKCTNCKIQLVKKSLQLSCPKCYSIIFEDFTEAISKNPQSSYDYKVNYDSWMNGILGKQKITKKLLDVLNQMKDYITENNIEINSTEDIRNVLKKINQTKYNKNTTLFFNMITSTKTPDIPDDKLYECKRLFSKSIEVQKKLFPKKKNSISHSFLIYKIFDTILDDKRILEYIHLPSTKTLEKREKEWKLIYMNL